MLEEPFDRLEEILWGTLNAIGESNLWGWNARPNGSFLVIDSQDSDATFAYFDTCFDDKWDHITIENASDEVKEIVGYLKGLRERQLLYTLPCSNDLVCYAAYWPWTNGNRASIRVSMFHTGLETLTSSETALLIQAVMNANNRSQSPE